MLKEVPAAFLSINQEVEKLQTQPSYQAGATKHTFCKVLPSCWTPASRNLDNRLKLSSSRVFKSNLSSSVVLILTLSPSC